MNDRELEKEAEKRASTRYPQDDILGIRCKVINVEDKSVLGHIADLSQTGIRIKSDKKYQVGDTFSADIELPFKYFNRTAILLDIVCKWTKENDLVPKHEAGFEFIDPLLIDKIFIETVCSLTTTQRLAMSFLDSPLKI